MSFEISQMHQISSYFYYDRHELKHETDDLLDFCSGELVISLPVCVVDEGLFVGAEGLSVDADGLFALEL